MLKSALFARLTKFMQDSTLLALLLAILEHFLEAELQNLGLYFALL